MSPKSRGRPPGRNRRAWAAPPGNGTYRELDLELLNPDDEDERSFLLEAQHPELETALARHHEDWVRRLDELPGDWPPPEELGLR
jgi:hypothetical protein